MIRLGVRLAVAGGRESAVRLVAIVLAVAAGAALLLAVLAGVNATQSQNARYGWLNSAVAPPAAAGAAADPMWWSLRADYFDGRTIGRVDVAGLGPAAPVPPGVPGLPGPGEFYASPALSDLLRSTPAAQLGDRFPGREIGTIGRAALPSPDALIVLVGRTPAEASRLPGAERISTVLTADPGSCGSCYVGIPSDGIRLILGVVGVALLFPLGMFIGTATRLAAARREQRFAAIRLAGAVSRQLTVIAGVESGLAALAGTMLGGGLYLALRPVLAGIAVTGERYYLSDLALTVPDGLAVAAGIPAGAVLAAVLALRRVRISPLGVVRRVTPRPPRAWRLIPVVAGVAELCFFVGRQPETRNGQLAAYLSGMVLIMAGLVVAGPWLAMLGSRVLARRAGTAPALIAGRRLADDPRGAFRAVSGLMLALFVTTVATGVISSFVANRDLSGSGTVAETAMSTTIWPDELVPGETAPQAAAVPPGLAAIRGVRGVGVVHADPAGDRRDAGPGLIACAELPAAFGSCPPGAQVANVYPDLIGPADLRRTTPAAQVWQAAPYTVDAVRRLPLLSVVVATDGSTAALEQSRTLLENTFPQGRHPAATDSDHQNDSTRSLARFQQLADVVILASLPIAGCGLAVAVAGGLSERRRPFSMLRLTGMRLAELRRVVLLESALPLLVVAGLAVGTGFLAAELFLRSQLGYDLVPPGGVFYATVLLGLAGSLGIIASTMPLLRRITGPAGARND